MAEKKTQGTYTGKSKVDSSPAALRDKKKIEQLKNKYDINDPEGLRHLYRDLNSGQIRFETQIGQQFDDEIYEAYQKLKENPPPEQKSKSGRSQKGEKRTASKKKEVKRLEDYDEKMRTQIIEEMKKAEKRRRLVIVLCSVAAVACIGYFAGYYIKAARSGNRWNDLSNLIGSEALANRGQNQNNTYNINYTDDNIEIPDVLDKYITLYNSNKNLIGWVKIDDTIIDYPVMQGSDNTYYLNHNFDQEEDRAGAIFLDCNCDVIRGNDNYIIYGHHMTSGRMFASLSDYESRRFYENHPYITFDTIYEEATYQVMYVFRSRIYNEDEVTFKYYQFIDAYSEEEFNSYMQEMADMSFYDTGVTAVYGDTLLTLSTCDYQETNGRFVVVAKRIS